MRGTLRTKGPGVFWKLASDGALLMGPGHCMSGLAVAWPAVIRTSFDQDSYECTTLFEYLGLGSTDTGREVAGVLGAYECRCLS